MPHNPSNIESRSTLAFMLSMGSQTASTWMSKSFAVSAIALGIAMCAIIWGE
jgi:hypothetical protein